MQLFTKFRRACLKVSKAAVAILYTLPRKFIKDVFTKKSLARVIEQLGNPNQTDELKAFSAAFGVFMGIIPIWGFQTLLAVFLSVALRLNKTLVVLFSLVSFPPVMPLIIFLSYRAGRYYTGNSVNEISNGTKTSFQSISSHLQQYIFGSVTLAFVAAIAVGLVTLAALKLAKVSKQYRLGLRLKKA